MKNKEEGKVVGDSNVLYNESGKYLKIYHRKLLRIYCAYTRKFPVEEEKDDL